jgi:chromosome segregation ATPase
LEDKNGEFSELKEEISTLTTKENKLKGDRLELVSSLSKFDKSLDEHKSKINGWKREVK